MRISLLLQREPFGEILEKTLAHFWKAKYGRVYKVNWYEGRPNLQAIRRPGEQAWLCNIYLNAIFAPDADQAIFDPIRREFARSLVPWRRPLQRAYVTLAVSHQGAPWLAQAGVGVTPAIPNVVHKLIVAGNHKLRILDHKAGLAYSILKHGFNSEFIQRELSTRRWAAELGLPVPRLEEVATDGSWFSERYLSGTPINRVADPEATREAAIGAANALLGLLTHTMREEGLDAYVARLYRRIQALVSRNRLLLRQHKNALVSSADALVEYVSGLRSSTDGGITTALSHGDFQPANLLATEQGVWLIDWEYAARRQIGYDALTFMLCSRFPKNLATRLQRFIIQGPDRASPMDNVDWPGVNWQEVTCRRIHGALFLLEELVLHLEENDNSIFFQPGPGLLTLVKELATLQPTLV